MESTKMKLEVGEHLVMDGVLVVEAYHYKFEVYAKKVDTSNSSSNSSKTLYPSTFPPSLPPPLDRRTSSRDNEKQVFHLHSTNHNNLKRCVGTLSTTMKISEPKSKIVEIIMVA